MKLNCYIKNRYKYSVNIMCLNSLQVTRSEAIQVLRNAAEGGRVSTFPEKIIMKV